VTTSFEHPDSLDGAKKRRLWTRPPILIAAAAGLALAGYASWTFANAPDVQLTDQPVATVARGPLRISVLERGNLRAKNSVKLRSELEGNSTILSLVQEGKSVLAGELLCELDVSNQVERRVQQRIAFESAEAMLVDARERLAIQKNQNESNITKATLAAEFAATELKKYVEGDLPQLKDTVEAQIKIAEAEKTRCEQRLDWSKKLYEQKFITAVELEADQIAFNKSDIDLTLAKRKLAVLSTYEGPMRIRKLEADRDEARRELDRVQRRANAEEANALAQLRAKEETHKLEKERRDKLEDQISKARIVAPRDGLVVYSTPGGGGGWRGRDQPIAIGSTVNERQEIIELPDTSSMVAELRIHESAMDRVSIRQSAIVTVDAFPEKPFAASVTYLGVVPDSQQSWLNPDLRVYRAEVELTGDTSDLRPQMSCSVEVLVEDLQNATFVPVQAIFRRAGKPVCYVVEGSTAKPHVVDPGLTNDRFVQIVRGVTEGQRVLLALPPGLGADVSVETPMTKVGEVITAADPKTLPPKSSRLAAPPSEPSAAAGAPNDRRNDGGRRVKGGGKGDAKPAAPAMEGGGAGGAADAPAAAPSAAPGATESGSISADRART